MSKIAELNKLVKTKEYENMTGAEIKHFLFSVGMECVGNANLLNMVRKSAEYKEVENYINREV